MTEHEKDQDKNQDNIDFSDGINYREAKLAFGMISFAVALIAGIVILATKGDIGENWAWVLAVFFAALSGEGIMNYLSRRK